MGFVIRSLMNCHRTNKWQGRFYNLDRMFQKSTYFTDFCNAPCVNMMSSQFARNPITSHLEDINVFTAATFQWTFCLNKILVNDFFLDFCLASVFCYWHWSSVKLFLLCFLLLFFLVAICDLFRRRSSSSVGIVYLLYGNSMEGETLRITKRTKHSQ